MCRKYWFEEYRPKPQGRTNFSRGANVLQFFCCLARISLHNILISLRATLRHVVFGLPAGFFLPVGLVQDFDYFLSRASTGSLRVVARGVQFQISRLQIFILYYHFTQFVGKTQCVTYIIRYLVVSRLLPLIAKYPTYLDS